MIAPQINVLNAGDYYGRMAQRREIAVALLTEAFYPRGHLTPAHVHERAYFSFALRGANDAIQNRSRMSTETSALMFHPPGALHAGHLRKDGGVSFFVEITSGLFGRGNDQIKLQQTSIAFQGGLTNCLLAKL